jgi:hypothetical protein
MKLRPRVVVSSLMALGLIIGLAWWLYARATYEAASGECPLANRLILILLVLWWWWPNPHILFEREAPFPSGQPGAFSTRSSKRIAVPLICTAASIIGWILFESRATDAAHLVAARQSIESLRLYETRSWEFFAFVYIWVVAFPILRTASGRAAIRAFSKRRLVVQGGIFIASAAALALFFIFSAQALFHSRSLSPPDRLTLLQVLLVRATVAIYALAFIRWITPISMFRLYSLFSTGIRTSAPNG